GGGGGGAGPAGQAPGRRPHALAPLGRQPAATGRRARRTLPRGPATRPRDGGPARRSPPSFGIMLMTSQRRPAAGRGLVRNGEAAAAGARLAWGARPGRRGRPAGEGGTMGTVTSTGTAPGAAHAADSHDLIRVHGARENNLRDISLEIPKRRLTVFTGVSGSGKSSLVFDTIATESQRLINETYSAFVQGFMPALARPDVDVLDGLTTAIIVDQQRMGSDPRSTVGTATDASAMLRILFSRLGEPHIGSPKAFSFNVASISGAGAVAFERGGETVKA